MTALNTIDPNQLAKLIVCHPKHGLKAWVTAYGRIKDKDGDLITPKLNAFQEEVCDAVAWFLVNRKPIRLVLLKPRQKGCSTISMIIMYWLMSVFGSEAALIGGAHDQTDNLWEIFDRLAKTDTFDWGFKRPCLAKSAKWDNGARVQAFTAKNEDAGRSLTAQALVATEAARWRDGKIANPDRVLQGILKCIPKRPQTCVILESTAKGPTGFFYRYYSKAITLEEAKAGKWSKNGYIKIFSPWFDHDDSRLWHETPPSKDFEKQLAAAVRGTYPGKIPDEIKAFVKADQKHFLEKEDPLTPEERQMAAKYNLSPDQIRWHRFTMEDECENDWSEMKREYPKTDKEAFHASSNQYFPSHIVDIMRQEAAASDPTWGTLEGLEGGDQFSLHPVLDTERNTADVMIWEPPQPGRSYILAVDCASLQPTTSSDPDKHAGLVIRHGYHDHAGRWKPHKVVARTVFNCRWDDDILEENIWRLCCYYGKCTIAPERNNTGEGLIQLLRKRGAPLYRTTSGDVKGDTTNPNRRLTTYGFLTTGGSAEGTRNAILSNLRRHLRLRDPETGHKEGMGIEFLCADGIEELENFIKPTNGGKPEAAEGYHDDDVMALAIGLHLVTSHSTVFVPVSHEPELPAGMRDDGYGDRGPRSQWSR